MIKTKLILFLYIISLIIIYFIITLFSSKLNNLDHLDGKWISYYKNNKITLYFRKNNNCVMKILNKKSKVHKTYNGNCTISTNKYPHSFIMKNIVEIDKSFYSIFRQLNKRTIEISEFSTQWKLRPISFNEGNIITFKKY